MHEPTPETEASSVPTVTPPESPTAWVDTSQQPIPPMPDAPNAKPAEVAGNNPAFDAFVSNLLPNANTGRLAVLADADRYIFDINKALNEKRLNDQEANKLKEMLLTAALKQIAQLQQQVDQLGGRQGL